MASNGVLPLDDDDRPALGLWDAAGHQIVAAQAGAVSTDSTTGTKYAAPSVSIANGNANGQNVMANSSPVVVASDQPGLSQMAKGDGEAQTNVLLEALGLYNSGGPVDTTGKPQQLSYDRIRSWQGKTLVSATITATVAGDTTLACTAGLMKTVMPGHLVRLTGGTSEYVKVAETYVVSSSATSIPLQTAVVNAGNTSASWDSFSVGGPGALVMLPTGLQPAVMVGYDANSALPVTLNMGNLDSTNPNHYLGVVPTLYNGGTNDKQRGNLDSITLVASAAYTTTQTSADQTNFNGRGVIVTLDMTNVAAAPSVTLEIDMKDPVSGKYVALLTGAAVTTVSTNVYTVYPGAAVTANVSASSPLPRTWRVKVTAGNANSGTYSVGASVIV